MIGQETSYFFGTIRQTVIWHTGNPTNTKENPADSKNVWPDSDFHSQVYSIKFDIGLAELVQN